MATLDRMKDLLTRFENNDPKLEAEILKIYSEKVKTQNNKRDNFLWKLMKDKII